MHIMELSGAQFRAGFILNDVYCVSENICVFVLLYNKKYVKGGCCGGLFL